MKNNRSLKMIMKKRMIKIRIRLKNKKNKQLLMKLKMIRKVNKKEQIIKILRQMKGNKVQVMNQMLKNKIIRRVIVLKVIKKHHYLKKMRIVLVFQVCKVHLLRRKPQWKLKNKQKQLNQRNLIFVSDHRFLIAQASMTIMTKMMMNTKKTKKYASAAKDN